MSDRMCTVCGATGNQQCSTVTGRDHKARWADPKVCIDCGRTAFIAFEYSRVRSGWRCTNETACRKRQERTDAGFPATTSTGKAES